MAEITVTDVVRCIVTTDDSLAALHEVVREFAEVLEDWTTCIATRLDGWSEQYSLGYNKVQKEKRFKKSY